MFIYNYDYPDQNTRSCLLNNLPFLETIKKQFPYNDVSVQQENALQTIAFYLDDPIYAQYDPLLLYTTDSICYLNNKMALLKALFFSSVNKDSTQESLNAAYHTNNPFSIKYHLNNFSGSNMNLWNENYRIRQVVSSFSLFNVTSGYLGPNEQRSAMHNSLVLGEVDITMEDIRSIFYIYLLNNNKDFLISKFGINEDWITENIGITDINVYLQKLALENKLNPNYFFFKTNEEFALSTSNLFDSCSQSEINKAKEYITKIYEKEVRMIQQVAAFTAFLFNEKFEVSYFQDYTQTAIANLFKDQNSALFKSINRDIQLNNLIGHKTYETSLSESNTFVYKQLPAPRIVKKQNVYQFLNFKNKITINNKNYVTNLPASLLSNFTVIPELKLPNYVMTHYEKPNSLFNKIGRATSANLNKLEVGLLSDISLMDYKDLEDKNYFYSDNENPLVEFEYQENAVNTKNSSWPIIDKKLFALNKALSESKITKKDFKAIVDEAFSVYGNSEIKCIAAENFLTKDSEEIEFNFETLSFKKLVSKTGRFVPVSIKLKVQNTKHFFFSNQKSEEIEVIVLLTLSSNITKVEKYSRAQKTIATLTNFLTYENGLYFHNPEKYREAKIKLLGNAAFYSSFFLNNLQQKVVQGFNKFLQLDDFEIPKPVAKKAFKSLTSKVNINKTIEENYLKLVNSNEKIESNLNKIKEETDISEERRKDILSTLERLNNTLEETKNQIELETNALSSVNLHYEEVSKSYKSVKQTYDNFLIVFNKAKEEYSKAYQKSLESSDFINDDFYDNLEAQGIYIANITLDNSEDGTTVSLDQHENNNNNFILTQLNSLLQKGKYKISKVTVVFSKPVKIKVDSGNKNSVYGGPYKVIAHDSGMKIAALNKSTVFGYCKSDNKIILHPHCGQTVVSSSSDINSLFEFRNCCLGESSPYIYNSFKENNLKMILMNISIWVSSANSTDAWGRNYAYMPTSIKNENVLATNIPSIYSVEEEILEECEKHNFVDGVCALCSHQCTHQFYDDNGNCMECNYYNPAFDQSNEEDEEYYECDHEYDHTGHCIHCDDYNMDYDQDLQQEGTPEEEQEAVLPEIQQTQNITYTPYVQLTNTNNNQG